jgi:hypothetical protein
MQIKARHISAVTDTRKVRRVKAGTGIGNPPEVENISYIFIRVVFMAFGPLKTKKIQFHYF